MARKLKLHLLRPDESVRAMCGKVTESASHDHEQTSCKTCSGMYMTNMEWYSRIRNKHVEPVGDTGEGDIYTRSDLEAGLFRMGWGNIMVTEILDNTKIFRNVAIGREVNPQGYIKGAPWG